MPKNSLARQNEACVLCEDVHSFAKNSVQTKSHVMHLGYGFFPCHITTIKNDYHSK